MPLPPVLAGTGVHPAAGVADDHDGFVRAGAKAVFHFDVPGSVAKSTMPGCHGCAICASARATGSVPGRSMGGRSRPDGAEDTTRGAPRASREPDEYLDGTGLWTARETRVERPDRLLEEHRGGGQSLPSALTCLPRVRNSVGVHAYCFENVRWKWLASTNPVRSEMASMGISVPSSRRAAKARRARRSN